MSDYLQEAAEQPTTGHPRGLPLLFFAEMWERFCFYGMRTLLVLYMVHAFSYTDGDAYGVYGNYNSLVYLTPFIGGIVADRLLGYRWTILLGGAVMAIGEFTLLIEQEYAFYAGMAMVIVGNGMFKPNISTLVGKLYREGDPRRDSGFTIFYMGINLGAVASTAICGYIGENFGWTYGFGLAGIGMLAGLITFARGRDRLEGHGEPPNPDTFASNMRKVIGVSVLAVPVLYFLLRETEVVFWLLLAMVVGVLGYMVLTAAREGKVQRERMFVLIVLWFFHCLFWAFFEQAGSSLTLFTQRNVDRSTPIGTMPVTWGQTFNPAFILLFGTMFTIMWVKLSKIGRNPSIPVKFGLGLIQLGCGYGVLVLGARFAGPDAMVPLIFLVLCYLLHTTGELFLSPIGLSAVTKLAPARMTGMVMGAWFLSISFGHKIAAIMAGLTGDAGEVEGESPAETLGIYNSVYDSMFWIAIGGGVLLLLLTPILKKWLHGVE